MQHFGHRLLTLPGTSQIKHKTKTFLYGLLGVSRICNPNHFATSSWQV